ncbi:MAG: DUF3556 domain-containing protein [Myxococcales bacterium]|nr:DUF3556 domain-containing protein [Myxococcales bacterium]
MFRPTLPAYDIEDWSSRPFPERLKMVCQSWAADGYGTPLAIYLLYALKIGSYIGMWVWFCTFTPGNTLDTFGSWWASDDAFAKAILWTMLFEGLGLGCGSGPLTGRYVPPLGGALYFLRPGTTKLPFVPGLPIVGGHRRTLLDVVAYAGTLGVLVAALTAPTVETLDLVPLLVLVPLMALGDKTLFLVFRSEHYLSAVIVLLFVDDWVAGSKFVWMAIWWWAATSKLNRHFPAVMGVMTSNAPFTRGTPLRRWVYRDFPHDLRPSRTAAAMAHFGTLVEYGVPLALLLSGGGPVTSVALFVMVGFHLFILFNVPMGVPLEWNVIMIYGALVLFGVHAAVPISSISQPALWAWLIGFHVLLPAFGSQFPRYVSFLLAMRYYAGNWAYNVWLFRHGSEHKLDRLTKWAPSVRQQLSVLYDDHTITAVASKVMAFRVMHILGRAVHPLLARTVDDIDDYEWIDGEIVAGLALGWNFGEGHLSHQQLLQAIQSQCGFEEGEVRCIMVESEPFFGSSVQWRIWDAAQGQLHAGQLPVDDLVDMHPWGETA